MLKLTRRRGESVRIGNAVVTIEHTGNHVRLAIDAPRNVPIVRTELETANDLTTREPDDIRSAA